MLTDAEKSIFSKFDGIRFVRVSAGILGQCEQSWERARRIAAEVDFDLAVESRRKSTARSRRRNLAPLPWQS